MTQEDKDLLLKDLSARLPYGVEICCTDNPKVNGHLAGIVGENVVMFSSGRADFPISDIRPYLRPMSSMTEEEKKEFENLLEGIVNGIERWDKPDLCEEYDWLNAHHIDYRGLIDKGLAIAVTEENNPYKE